VGARSFFRSSAILLALVGVCALALRSTEGSVVVASMDREYAFGYADPAGASDPLSCIERVAIPQIDNALETVWAPDGTHLAFTRIVASSSSRTVTGYEEDPALAILDMASGRITQLGLGKDPRWSASGVYLSFWRAGHLFVVRGGRAITEVGASMPEVRWVGEQLVYFSGDEIRGWTEAADASISHVSYDLMPRFPRDWTEFSADGQMFTLTRYYMDGRGDRYVGETRTGQLAPLNTPGTVYTQWAPTGQLLLVRNGESVELRGSQGWDAVAAVSSFPGPVHGWAPDGKTLLMGKVAPTVPAGPAFDRFAAWDGRGVTGMATLPNLLGGRTFSADGRYFAGIARAGLYETTLEVYRCGSSAPSAPSRADPVSRSRQQRIDADGRRFVRPVVGYFSQFLQGSHTGIDVAAPYGSIITAADEGDVTFVGWRPVGGRAVCVQHAGGLEDCDYHTSLALVTVGQHVQRGEPVALIGMTGQTTGPHVHWEAKQNGLIVDPLKK
jgi:murein DD-endopeptidase MepM/ murein hydrolase activator NlpD